MTSVAIADQSFTSNRENYKLTVGVVAQKDGRKARRMKLK